MALGLSLVHLRTCVVRRFPVLSTRPLLRPLRFSSTSTPDSQLSEKDRDMLRRLLYGDMSHEVEPQKWPQSRFKEQGWLHEEPVAAMSRVPEPVKTGNDFREFLRTDWTMWKKERDSELESYDEVMDMLRAEMVEKSDCELWIVEGYSDCPSGFDWDRYVANFVRPHFPQNLTSPEEGLGYERAKAYHEAGINEPEFFRGYIDDPSNSNPRARDVIAGLQDFDPSVLSISKSIEVEGGNELTAMDLLLGKAFREMEEHGLEAASVGRAMPGNFMELMNLPEDLDPEVCLRERLRVKQFLCKQGLWQEDDNIPYEEELLRRYPALAVNQPLNLEHLGRGILSREEEREELAKYWIDLSLRSPALHGTFLFTVDDFAAQFRRKVLELADEMKMQVIPSIHDLPTGLEIVIPSTSGRRFLSLVEISFVRMVTDLYKDIAFGLGSEYANAVEKIRELWNHVGKLSQEKVEEFKETDEIRTDSLESLLTTMKKFQHVDGEFGSRFGGVGLMSESEDEMRSMEEQLRDLGVDTRVASNTGDLPEDANPVTEAEIEKVVGMDENSDIDDSNIEVDPFSDIPVEEDVQMTSEDRGGRNERVISPPFTAGSSFSRRR